MTIAALLLSATAAAAATQDDAVASGQRIYTLECASCHGASGVGYGPAAPLLRTQPPDLTSFRNRKTPFPRERIFNTVTGRVRLIPSHGDDMPLWRNLPEINALLAYLESIQRHPFGAYAMTAADLAAAGAALYATHCAACHGADGRGLRPSGYVVGVARPDLTRIAARNGGFDLRKVMESIARCRDDDRHQDMPSWRHQFERAGWSSVITTANLDSLARYLESIQR